MTRQTQRFQWQKPRIRNFSPEMAVSRVQVQGDSCVLVIDFIAPWADVLYTNALRFNIDR